MAGIAAALAQVKQEIAAACRNAERDPDSVALVAVTKTFAPEVIEQAIAAGQKLFGENRVQESKAKWPALKEKHPGVALHLIGPLQSNKAKEAVVLFDAIHSVDRPSICEVLAKEIDKQGRMPLLFVEINTGAEPQKAGVLPEQADAFLKACRETYGLSISGLMCIPPLKDATA
jgi:pyridoxal phosphate enzyme (YggS family)